MSVVSLSSIMFNDEYHSSNSHVELLEEFDSCSTMSVGHSVPRRDDEEESEAPVPPDGGWGWLVVFGSFMIHVINDGVTYSFGIFYDEFLEYFGEGKALTSWILSILVGVTLCSGPISSYFVNRWGCRTVTIAGSILASSCLAVSFWAKNVMTLCITIGIGAGTGFGLIYLPAIVSVTTYFEKKRSLATGIAVCGSGFGTFIFAPIISILLAEYGWRGSILIIAGIVLECILFGALFRPLEAKPVGHNLNVTAANIDIHISDHDLPQFTAIQSDNVVNGGTNNMHRPHSVSHFFAHKGSKQELNGNVPNKIKTNNNATRLALSQPMLAQPDKHSHYFGSQSWKKHHGPIDRIDVFYQGSLMNIPSYRSRLSLRKGEEGPFMERRHSSYSHHRRRCDSEKSAQKKVCGIFACSDEVREMLDFSLFKDLVFILFSLSNLLTSIGFNIPYVYVVPKGKDLGMTVKTAGILISIMGAANTIGRIVLGYLSDKPWVNRLCVYNWCLTICGLATFFSAFCTGFYSLAVYSTVFGFTIGAYVGLTSVILVDLLGLEKLTNAFGLLLLFQGIASLIGPPLAGGLYDITGSYNPGFCLAGIAIGLSGLILFFIPAVQRWQARRTRNQQPAVADL